MLAKLKSKLKAFALNKHVLALSIVFGGLFGSWVALYLIVTYPIDTILICMSLFTLYLLYLGYCLVLSKVEQIKENRRW